MSIRTIENLLPKANGSVYALIRMAAKRALEIAEGKKPLVEVELNAKATTTALHEIDQGKVCVKEVEDQFLK